MDVPKRRMIVDIHSDIENCVTESGVQEGMVLVNAKHIV